MTRFVTGRVIRSKQPTMVVDPGLEPGRHRFEVTAIDRAGNRSKPALVTVTIARSPNPFDPGGAIRRPR